MKQDILLLNPILIPTINDKLSETYNVDATTNRTTRMRTSASSAAPFVAW